MGIKKRVNRHGLTEYGCDFYISGKGSPRRQVWGFANEADAKAALQKIDLQRKQNAHGLIPGVAPKLSDLFEKHLQTAQTKRQQWHVQRVCKMFLAILPKTYTVTQLATADFDLYINKRTADGVAAATIRRELVVVSAALHAAGRYFRELNHYQAPRVYYPRNSRKRRERVIEPQELEKLLGWLLAPKAKGEHQIAYAARKRVGLVFTVGMLTGARLGEIARLQWHDIKEERGILLITGTKTEYSKDTPKAREIPLTSTLQWALDERRKDTNGKGYVFFKSERVPPTFYEILKKACQQTGLPYGQEENGIVFHHLRHTAVSTWLRNGVDLGTVQGLTGSSAAFVLHYAHLTQQGREKAGQVMESEMGTMVEVERK